MGPKFFGRWDDEAWSFGWFLLGLITIVGGFALLVGGVLASIVCAIGGQFAPSRWFEGDAFFYWTAAIALPFSAYWLGQAIPVAVYRRRNETIEKT